jgi:hypothetical protein
MKEEIQKKIDSINQWQWMCFLPGIVFLVTGRGAAIDAEHARNAALFRLVVNITGFVIFGILQLVKARWKSRLRALEKSATPSDDVRPPIPPPQ